VLKEEKRLLAVQLKAKDVRTNMRSVGVGDSPVHKPEVASRPVVPTAEAGVGASDVNDELLPSAEITRLVRETVEITRQREIHTWIQGTNVRFWLSLSHYLSVCLSLPGLPTVRRIVSPVSRKFACSRAAAAE